MRMGIRLNGFNAIWFSLDICEMVNTRTRFCNRRCVLERIYRRFSCDLNDTWVSYRIYRPKFGMAVTVIMVVCSNIWKKLIINMHTNDETLVFTSIYRCPYVHRPQAIYANISKSDDNYLSNCQTHLCVMT